MVPISGVCVSAGYWSTLLTRHRTKIVHFTFSEWFPLQLCVGTGYWSTVVLESPLVHILASIVAHVFEEENLPMQTPSTLGISAAMGIRDSHGYLRSQTSIDIPSKHWYPPYLDFNRHRCAHP